MTLIDSKLQPENPTDDNMRLNMNEVNVTLLSHYTCPDNKAHGANMGPIWGRQDPVGSHVGPMNLTIWVSYHSYYYILQNTEILHMHEKSVYLKHWNSWYPKQSRLRLWKNIENVSHWCQTCRKADVVGCSSWECKLTKSRPMVTWSIQYSERKPTGRNIPGWTTKDYRFALFN